MKLDSFNDLMESKPRDLYSAEQGFAAAQPAMVEDASDDELRAALEGHVAVPQGQLERLGETARLLGIGLGERCEAALGLVEEGQKILKAQGDPFVEDAALLAAAEATEHYEIAGYGTASAYARQLGRSDVEGLLQRTLAEERGADLLLNEVAEASVNRQAAH